MKRRLPFLLVLSSLLGGVLALSTPTGPKKAGASTGPACQTAPCLEIRFTGLEVFSTQENPLRVGLVDARSDNHVAILLYQAAAVSGPHPARCRSLGSGYRGCILNQKEDITVDAHTQPAPITFDDLFSCHVISLNKAVGGTANVQTNTFGNNIWLSTGYMETVLAEPWEIRPGYCFQPAHEVRAIIDLSTSAQDIEFKFPGTEKLTLRRPSNGDTVVTWVLNVAVGDEMRFVKDLPSFSDKKDDHFPLFERILKNQKLPVPVAVTTCPQDACKGTPGHFKAMEMILNNHGHNCPPTQYP